MSSGNITALQALSGTNTGDETASSIESKLSVSAGNITALSNLSGTNTGDQTLSGLGGLTRQQIMAVTG